MKHRFIFLSALLLAPWVALHAAALEKLLPLPGQVFEVEGRTAFVILPSTRTTNQLVPWVWYAPTLPGLPGNEERWMFDQFLDAGIAIAGIDVGESFGSPAGRKLFSAFHAEMTGARGYSLKPVLLGRSRGGLMTLAWAAENPDKVAGFAGIYPVCNIASYPGIAKAAGAYEMKPEELQAHLKEHNPIDRLAPLARAGVPLFAIHGDVDTVVPLAANSGLVKERYTALGGSMQLIIPPGQGHNMWPGFFQSQELVSFVKAQAGPNITMLSPLDHQVFQRSSNKKGSVLISGELAGFTAKKLNVEERPVRVLVWDEQQPEQKRAYGEKFLGETIAAHLTAQRGFVVKSVSLTSPSQGLDEATLNATDVVVWWSHQKNHLVTDENVERLVTRVHQGKLGFVALHSAHWAKPFVRLMQERAKDDALAQIPTAERATAKFEFSNQNPYGKVPKRDAPLTPSLRQEDGVWKLALPGCIFPAYRGDGAPSHVTTLLPGHPIAAGLPLKWDVTQTEMYDEPFHVPKPDAVVFEERWDKGEHFRSGCVWQVGQGRVFYFRPGHETYPVFKQAEPLRVLENAARWLAAPPKIETLSAPRR